MDVPGTAPARERKRERFLRQSPFATMDVLTPFATMDEDTFVHVLSFLEGNLLLMQPLVAISHKVHELVRAVRPVVNVPYLDAEQALEKTPAQIETPERERETEKHLKTNTCTEKKTHRANFRRREGIVV